VHVRLFSARIWAGGVEPLDLPRIEPAAKSTASTRGVFVFFINSAKERALAAATGLRQRLGFQAPCA